MENLLPWQQQYIAGRSISSLGGSYLNSNGGNMSSVEKIAISAVIGGTAEALGGGRFANGAVTGAYVMAFNHLMHNKIWHPSRVSAEKALITRVITTGKEGTVQVFIDECGDEYFWEAPADPNDSYKISYYPSSPPVELGELKYVEQFHYSQGYLSPDGDYLAGSWEDWLLTFDGIKVTHNSLGFGSWTFMPGTLFNPAASFRGLFNESVKVWSNPTPYGTFPYDFKLKL